MAEKVLADVIYKAFLQNEDIFTHLQHLVRQAEEFYAKKSDYDVIKEYMQLSGNCQEIIQFLKELHTCDSHNAMMLLNALCHILIRLASDLHMFIAAGTSITNEILSYGMKTLFNFLKLKQKSSRTKLALHLLTAMIALGDQIAHQVVAKLNFSNPEFIRLLNRTNFSEDEDVRTAFLNMIVLIITVCNNNVIRQIVEVKGFLNNIFPGLISDRVSTITLVLSTFQQHIVENPNIPKTIKIHLFNDHSLKPILQLYTWKGPVRNKKFGKRKLGEEDRSIAYDVSDDEIAEVHSCTHKFMMALCCSHKTGIIFHDPLCGTSGRNNNHVITNILKSASQPYSDPLISEFVISVLQACPDQLKFYLPIFQDSFVPRLSISWLNAVDFLKKILKSQSPVSVLFKTQGKKSMMALVSIAKVFCMLDVLKASDISEVFVNGHHALCHYLCSFLLSIFSQVKAILDFCDNPDSSAISYENSELSTFKLSFLSILFSCLPVGDMLQKYWNKISSKTPEAVQDETLTGLPLPTLSEELLVLIDVIKLFKNLSDQFNREFDFDFHQMLNNLKVCGALLSRSDLSKIYISVMDLMSEQYSATLWHKEKITDSPLMLILEVYLAAHKSKQLLGARNIVYKILLHTKVFECFRWELDIWLDALECAKSRHIPFIFEFISAAVHSLLIEKPNSMKLEIVDISNESNASEDDEVVFVLSNKRQRFSKFIPAALRTLQVLDESKKKGCQTFVEEALISIMHYQHSAKDLFTAVEKYKPVISSHLFEYWKFLANPSKIKVEVDLTCTGNILCALGLSAHLKQNFLSNHVSSVKTSNCSINNLLENLDSGSIRKAVWQILMYADLEASLILKKKADDDGVVVSYIQMLEHLLNSLPLFKDDMMDVDSNEEIIKIENNASNKQSCAASVLDAIEDSLTHPILLKLFLFNTETAGNVSNCLINSITATTKLVIEMIQKVLSLGTENQFPYLVPFKNKVFKYLQKGNKFVKGSDIELVSAIGTVSPLFSMRDIHILLENLLNVRNDTFLDFDEYFSCLCLLLQMFLEKKEFVLLSSTCFNALILKFASMPKKRKKILRQHLLQLLRQHPSYALFLTEDSSILLLQHKSAKDLTILGEFIKYSSKFRQITQTFVNDTVDETDGIDFVYLVSKCLCHCSGESEQDNAFRALISSRFIAAVKETVFEDISTDLDILQECNAGKAMQVLLREKSSKPKKLLDFGKLLLKDTESKFPSLSKMHVILQIFESWKIYNLEADKTRIPILKISCLWLSSGFSEDSKILQLTSFIKEVLESIDSLEVEDIIDVNDFFSKSLKFALKFDDTGKDILKILQLLCTKSKGNTLPVQSIYDLLTGHSRFFEVMLSDETAKSSLKECVIDLLIALAKLDGTVCKENHVGLLLSAYGASMTTIDQKLLYLLKLYADNNINMITYSPFLWGKSALSHYSIMKSAQSYLWKQPKLQDVLRLVLQEKMESTVLNFPLNMKLQPTSDLVEVEEHLANKIYDLRFFLPLFAHLLSPGAFVNCSQFVQSKVLMLIFISLSSLEAPVRALGYYCLSEFYQHLESAYFREKEIWLCLLDSLRNSIVSTNPKVPNIVSLFLARTADIFTKPDHKLYCIVYTFIMRKPCIDIGQVPEYYNLFNSTYIEHRVQRQWLLNLLADGLRTSLDFHICEKRYVFKTLLVHYVSCLSTNQEKVAILQALNSATKVKSAARTLCQNSLLTWLQNVIEESDSSEIEILKNICAIMNDLGTNAPDHYHFSIVLWHLIDKMKFLDISTVKSLISTLLSSLTTLKNSEKTFWSRNSITRQNVDQLYELWKSMIEKFQSKESEKLDQKMASEAINIGECHLIFAQILTLWEPLIQENIPDILYNNQMKSLTNSLKLMLKTADDSSFYFNDLPVWLHKCTTIDAKRGLVKMILSSEGSDILTSIVQLFERCLCQEHELFNPTQARKNSDFWKKFLLFLKDASTDSSATCNSSMFQEISHAIHQ